MNIKPLVVRNRNTKFIQGGDDGAVPIDIASFLQPGQLYKSYKPSGINWDDNTSSPLFGEILCFVGVDTPETYDDRHKLVFIRQDGTLVLWGFYWVYSTQYLPSVAKLVA